MKTVSALAVWLVACSAFAAEPATGLETNLLVNPGAEDGLKGWNCTPVTYGRGDRGAKEGKYFFAPGPNKAKAKAEQEVDISFAKHLADGDPRPLYCVLRGWMKGYEGDESQMFFEFLGDKGQVYERVKSQKTASEKWEPFEKKFPLPPPTAKVRVRLESTYHHGEKNNDGYFDDLYLGLTHDPN